MSDRPDLINSEMGGVAFNSVDQCFKQALLKQMFSDIIPVRIEFNTRFFVTIDPAAGGEHSDFAMVSFTCSYGVYKVFSAGSPRFCFFLGLSVLRVCVCHSKCCHRVSRQHHQRFDLVKDVGEAANVLRDGDGLKEIFLRDCTHDRDGHVRVQRYKHDALPEKGVLDVFRQAGRTTRHKVDFFLNILVFEHLVFVVQLRVQDPVSHLVVDGQEEKEQHHDMRVAYCVSVQDLEQFVQTAHCVFEAAVVLFRVLNHFPHQHAHKRRVLRENSVKEHIIHLQRLHLRGLWHFTRS